jgi:hypothetical protein
VKYMLLITWTERDESPTPEEDQAMMQAYMDFEKSIAEAGIRVAGDALQPNETASCVQVGADGERVITDGPFAETREVLGGYYVLDVPDLDAALDWAARCPGSHGGGKIEVRPIQSYDF